MAELIAIFLQYLGFLSIALIIMTGYFLVKNDSGANHTSVSSYAGSNQYQARLGFLALVIFSVPFYIWLLFWLVPTYSLSAVLYPFIVLSFICHLLLVRFPLVPSKGRKHITNLLHLGAGATIALCMLGLVVTLLGSITVNELVATASILLATALYMVGCLIAYVILRDQKYFLEFEVGYILLFAVSIGTVTLRI